MASDQSTNAHAYTLKDSSTDLTIELPRYQLTITRCGFGLTLRRGTDIILQSAHPADLSFERNGTGHHVA